MQKEARRVQDENKLLRTLLYSQGFDNTAIESALQSMKLPMASQDPKSQTLVSSMRVELATCFD